MDATSRGNAPETGADDSASRDQRAGGQRADQGGERGVVVLPVPNQPAILRDAVGREYATWVLDVGIRGITLTRSDPSLDEPVPEPGDPMEMCWPIDEGEQILSVEFVGNQRADSELLWDVRPSGLARRRQRRSHPRVLTFVPATLGLAGGETHDAMLLDASEVALRVHLSADLAGRLSPETAARAQFGLGGKQIDVSCHVMRTIPTADGGEDVVLTVDPDSEGEGSSMALRAAVSQELAGQE